MACNEVGGEPSHEKVWRHEPVVCGVWMSRSLSGVAPVPAGEQGHCSTLLTALASQHWSGVRAMNPGLGTPQAHCLQITQHFIMSRHVYHRQGSNDNDKTVGPSKGEWIAEAPAGCLNMDYRDMCILYYFLILTCATVGLSTIMQSQSLLPYCLGRWYYFCVFFQIFC